jgi:hypothetical protein
MKGSGTGRLARFAALAVVTGTSLSAGPGAGATELAAAERLAPTEVDSRLRLANMSDRSRTYRDRVGDNDEFAPDISQIVVRLTGNRLTFRVGIATLGPGLIDGDFLAVAVDTDRNARTGCEGAEVVLAATGNTGGPETARWGRCAGGNIGFGRPQGSFAFSLSPGTGLEGPGAVWFSIGVSELGATAFNFVVASLWEGRFDDYFDDAGPFVFRSSPTSTTRIVIAPHANVRAEATSPRGARVTYVPVKVRGAKTVTYSKPSGSVFALGRTTVRITARNGRQVARSSFAVIVADTTRPVFAPLPAVGTNATEPTRATVSFGPITATDRVDRDVVVTCTPPSGSVFAPGTTAVSCTARDDAGNTAASVFRIGVPVYGSQMSLQTNTAFQYDQGGRLLAATTTMTIEVPPAAEGSPAVYAWSASSGTIAGGGPTATWTRQLDSSGQPAPGTITVTLTYPGDRTESRTIQFP